MTRPKSYVNPENLTEFGRYFEAVTRILGVSHQKVSRDSGIPQPTLWTWTNDSKRPSPGSLEKLFVALRKYEGWRGEEWERGLTNLANHVTPQQRNEALDNLVQLESEVRNRTLPNVREE